MRRRPVHIVTLEDPIEFVHEQKRGTFSQRELGSDFEDFASGLRSAMRQAPKVILVGEMRDRATVEIALSAAETGHLVLSTLPTISAGQSVNRLLGMLDPSEHPHLRLRLVESLRYIVSQRLVPKLGGGRHLVQEIMGANLRVRETLALGEGEGRNFYDIDRGEYPGGLEHLRPGAAEAPRRRHDRGGDRAPLLAPSATSSPACWTKPASGRASSKRARSICGSMPARRAGAPPPRLISPSRHDRPDRI